LLVSDILLESFHRVKIADATSSMSGTCQIPPPSGNTSRTPSRPQHSTPQHPTPHHTTAQQSTSQHTIPHPPQVIPPGRRLACQALKVWCIGIFGLFLILGGVYGRARRSHTNANLGLAQCKHKREPRAVHHTRRPRGSPFRDTRQPEYT